MAQTGPYSDILDRLAALIESRRGSAGDQSYTASLLEAGLDKCAEKLGEESLETVIALVKGDKAAITQEAADMLYHLLVALAAAGVSFEDVCRELERRTGQSGLAEKASRS
jgi:phosphoribosyl-ATP pyrophosphohydrolase